VLPPSPDRADDSELQARARTYAQLRESSPIWNEAARTWVVSRYADVSACLRQEALSSRGKSEGAAPLQAQAAQPLATRLYGRQLESIDPPHHTRLRRPFASLLSSDLSAWIRPFIVKTVRELVGEARRRVTFDFVRDIADPLPPRVIAKAIGLPTQQLSRFRAQVDATLRAMAPRRLAAEAAAGEEAAGLICEVARSLTASPLRAEPGSLLHRLAEAAASDDAPTSEEVAGNLILFLAAGHDTTTNLIANGAAALLSHPAQRALLCARPDLIASAVEEILRFDSPIQILKRRAAATCDVGGATVAAGQTVVLLIGAANRDPAEFIASEELRIDRAPNRHLAFGVGRHFCLGAALARCQASEVFAQTLPLYDQMTLVGPLIRRKAASFSGMRSIPCRLDQRSRS
jgi:cytochrome P450